MIHQPHCDPRISGGCDCEPDPREPLGRLVREVWVEWASEQSDPKPSWLVPWEELDEGQREVDMRIGAAIRAEIEAEARWAASQVGRHPDYDWDRSTLLWLADRMSRGEP